MNLYLKNIKYKVVKIEKQKLLSTISIYKSIQLIFLLKAFAKRIIEEYLKTSTSLDLVNDCNEILSNTIAYICATKVFQC